MPCCSIMHIVAWLAMRVGSTVVTSLSLQLAESRFRAGVSLQVPPDANRGPLTIASLPVPSPAMC